MASNKKDILYSIKYQGEKTLLGYVLLILLLPAAALLYVIKRFNEYVEIEEYIKSKDNKRGN